MTPEQLEIVESTAVRLDGERRRFADTFYNHLFEVAPHTRELFPDDLSAQKDKLVDEVTFLAAAASDLDTFVQRATELGARHHGYGVHVADYVSVEAALLAGIEAVLGEETTPDVTDAWRRLYRFISETMIDGASSELYTIT